MPDELPFYWIYGEAPREVDLHFVHVERVSDRAHIHDGHVRPHRHPHLHQISLWLAGEGIYRLEEQRIALPGAALSVAPAGAVHGFDVTGSSDAIVVSMSDGFKNGCLADTDPRILECVATPLILPIPPERQEEALRLFTGVEREYRHYSWGQKAAVGAHVHLIAVLAARLHETGTGNPPRPARGRLLQRFHLLIERHFRERWPIARFAAALGTTPYLLNRAAMEGHGLGASAVVRQRTTTEAKRLLLYTMLQITEISATLGYDDPTHFARAFRRETGEQPSVWREKGLLTARRRDQAQPAAADNR